MQGIFQKENTDKALKYGIYRHLPTYEKIIRNLVSFYARKISLILLIPFGSLIGISILFNVYNDYLKMAASQYNYDYLYICLFRLLEALILFISILVYMKDIQKEDNKLKKKIL